MPGVVALAVLTALAPARPVATVSAAAAISFPAPVGYEVDADPVWVADGDLNGDGKPDLAVANAGSNAGLVAGDVSVLLGNGDGTFRTVVHYGVGVTPLSVVVADLNDDRRPDLNVGTQIGVSVLLGNGDGTFRTTGTGYGSNGGEPSSLVVGDLNGDAKPDVAML